MTEDRGSLAGRRVVVGVAGSIAAYKAVSLVRLLAERGALVDVAMTPAATQFVTPLTFASLTHRRVVDDVMALDADSQIAHVELAEGADAIVIAPATANLLAELAAGNASNAANAAATFTRGRSSGYTPSQSQQSPSDPANTDPSPHPTRPLQPVAAAIR